MKKFSYIISSSTGKRSKGTLQAATLEDAQKRLQKEGHVIIALREDAILKRTFFNGVKMSFQDKMMFAKHLSTMLASGITLTEALTIMAQELARPGSKKMLENIVNMVHSGQKLSASLAHYKTVFSDVFVNMVAIGEESGTLDKTLGYLDMQLEKENDLRKKVISAMIYPAVIVGITVALVLGIVIFIMPKITEIFGSFEVGLPLPTRILIGFSNFILHKPHFALLILVGLGGLGFMLMKIKAFRPILHRLVLVLPVFGRLMKNVNLARFSRTLNTLLTSGVPISKALEVTGDMFSNVYYQSAIREAQAKVIQGAPIGESFEANPKLFPPLVTKMLTVGEKSGSLELTTSHLANLYEKNVDSITRNLTSLLEPFLLLFMSALVGGVAISIILPIYQLPNLLNK